MLAAAASAKPDGFNYEESKVPAYTLPDVLTYASGEKVVDAAQWKEKRRSEILATLEKEQYGKPPPRPNDLHYKVMEEATPALDGLALRKQVRVFFSANEAGPAMDLLLYLPAKSSGPSAVFWGLNFEGNHSVSTDAGIHLCRSWMRNNKEDGITENKATEKSRGSQQSRYALPEILNAGYGLATAYYGDIDPDFDDGFKNGVHSLYPDLESGRGGDTWGSIAAWAWGMQVGQDYFEKDSAIDAKRVIVMGHSRLGKTALWAGATDERFAIVISNDSGCGGAALHKRVFGETVARINTSFPHWFCRNFRRYNDREADLAFDQHWLISAIAPRPVLICSATEDAWADPRGEFLSGFHASPVFKLLGVEGLAAAEMPPPDQLVNSRLGYHLRTGAHDVTLADWKAYITFANKHLPRK